MNRAYCLFLAALFALASLIAVPAQAQTATADWSSLGLAPLAGVPKPSTISASDGTSVTVDHSIVISGGNVSPGFGADFVDYYTAAIGGVSPSLLLNMDNNSYDPNDIVTLDVTLGRTVTNLNFTIADIDRDTFRDTIEVLYDNGDGTWRNVADTTSFWTLGGDKVERVNNNTANGWRGKDAVGNNSAGANVAFNFGSTGVKRIRIRYFSWSGNGNPTAQYVALSRLQFTSTGADLSLSKTLLTATPLNGAAAVFRLTVTSAASSSQTATGVQVRDVLPAGFTYLSSSGTGTYNSATGIWDVGSVSAGQSRSIDITGTVTASSGASLLNTAEIISSSATDPDSIPNNGATSEDDYASATLTVSGSRGAGTPPTLVCTAGSVLFDWSTRSWTSGSTDNTYALSTLGNIRFQLANPGNWLNSATYNGLSPAHQNAMGGATNDFALVELVDLPNQSSMVTTTITLPTTMAGAQFKLFDVDHFAGQFADRVEIVGRLNGVDVIPVLTNGLRNYVIGNTAYGDSNADNGTDDGNVTVTFNSPISSIIIRYGNHSLAPTDPGQQAIALHDITLCNPVLATLDVTKVSQVLSDPVSGTTSPKAIPGAIIQYCITIGNSGAVAATNIAATDNLPANLTYVVGSLLSGVACNNAATVEDDNASGADEIPIGANRSGSTINMSATTLAAGSSFAVTFRATVN